MKLIFVRHGETEWNRKGILQGSRDLPLNEAGLAQAHQTASLLTASRIDRVVSSPLLRARQTAQVIAGGRGLAVETDERICERYFGAKEGKPMVRGEFNTWWAPGSPGKDGMEPADQFYKRVFSCLDDLRSRYQNETVLMTAHGGVSIAVHCYYRGFPEDVRELAQFAPNAAAIEYEQPLLHD